MKTRFGRSLAILFGLSLTLFINYHTIFSNPDLVPGSKADTRLFVFLLEHWFNVFRGKEAWFSINMFYPDKLAFGYADGFFLLSLPYIVFRGLGFNYFSSFQLLFFFMTSLGYAAYILLLGKVMKINLYFCIAGSVLLTCLNAMQLQVGNGKLLGFYFYPVLVILLYHYLSSGNKRNLWGWCSLLALSLLLGLLFFTSYYPAWFFLSSLFLFGLLYIILSALRRGTSAIRREIIGFFRENGVQLAAALLVFVLSLIPFWVVYAPLVGAKRAFGIVLSFSPSFKDIINVSNSNLLWSPVLNRYHFKFGDNEAQWGSPLIVLTLFLIYYIYLFLFNIRKDRSAFSSVSRYVFVLSTIAFVIFALVVHFHGHTLWYIVYLLVPGASALRVVGRYLIVIDMIVVVTVIYALSELYEFSKAHISGKMNYVVRSAILLVSGILLFEQINSSGYDLDKSEQISFLSRYGQPQTKCNAFFIDNAPLSGEAGFVYQIDAMMISMNLHIPTMNGYSGIRPDDVFAMVPSGVEYKYKILKWALVNKLDNNICELDYQSGVFRSVNVPAEYPEYEQVNQARNVETFSVLYSATEKFFQDKNDLSDLYPQYLETHGYLDASFGYGESAAYKWMQDRYWIGSRPCPKNQCMGIGIVGTYAEIQGIVDKYKAQATQVFFPFPEMFKESSVSSNDAEGELLMVFPVTGFEK